MAEPPLLIPVEDAVEVRIATSSGRVSVIAEARDDLAVTSGQGGLHVERDGRTALLLTPGRGGSQKLELRCPLQTNLTIGTNSGRVELRGALGVVRVTTSAGRIEVEQAESAELRSASGDISLGMCSVQCRLHTKSGRAEVGSSGRTEIATESGRVEVVKASGQVRVRTTSGRVELGAAGHDDVAVQTMSGSVKIKLPRGVRPAARLHSLSGEPCCEMEEGDDCRVAVQSMSGRIEVLPA